MWCWISIRFLHSKMPLVPTHACSLEASMHVTNGISLGSSLLPFGTEKLVQTLQVIYAPMSDVGGILYDKDTTMLEVGAAAASIENSAEPRHVLLRDLKELDNSGGSGSGSFADRLGGGGGGGGGGVTDTQGSKISLFGGGAVLGDAAVGAIVSEEADIRRVVRCAVSDRLSSRGVPIEFHAFDPLEASMRVTNTIPLGCALPLTFLTVN
jgi:hypothetical protein